MAQPTDHPGDCPARTSCPDDFDPNQLLRIGLGPNAKATVKYGALQGLFVRLKLSVAKILRTLADKLD